MAGSTGSKSCRLAFTLDDSVTEIHCEYREVEKGDTVIERDDIGRIIIHEQNLCIPDGNIPLFRCDFHESWYGRQTVDSLNGRISKRLNPGGSIHTLALTPLGTDEEFSFEYSCLYKEPGSEVDRTKTARDGAPCPSSDAESRYIKQFGVRVLPASNVFTLAYCSWISRFNEPHVYERDPPGRYYLCDGSMAGATRDSNEWVTAFEFVIHKPG